MTSYTINIQTPRYPVDVERLKLAIITVLDQHDVSRNSSLTVVIQDNDEVRRLNSTYRQIDAPTDILSFPADSLPHLSDEPPYLGDLIIAYPYTSQVAKQRHVDLAEVLCLLVIHGTLHLLGYDHMTNEEKDEMWTAQADTLTTLKINPTIVDQYGA